jgi:hypothetical protein
MLSSPSPLSYSHHLLAVTFSWISPLSRTEPIEKYSSIENFMKLPFQRVIIHRKRSSNKGALSVLLQRCVLSKTDFRRVVLGDSAIAACRNLRLSWFLICWNHNFMGLLNIQKYLVFHFETTQNSDEIGGFLRIDPETLMILIILSSRASCCTSVLKIRGLPHS